MGIDNIAGTATLKGLEGLFANLVSALLGFAAIGFFVMLLVGGFKYLTSGGNPQAVESAKNTLTFAFLGIVLMASSYLALRLLGTFTGVNLNIFQVVIP